MAADALAMQGTWASAFSNHGTTDIVLAEYACFSPRVDTLRPTQNSHHFPDEIFKCSVLNENVRISIKISLEFVPKGPINYFPSLVHVMAWYRPGYKPLSEPMMVSLLKHIYVTASTLYTFYVCCTQRWQYEIWIPYTGICTHQIKFKFLLKFQLLP